MFVDEVQVYLKAGDGGRGCVSFRRAKFEPFGGPNGGNGGRGGDIILLGDENVSDLTEYKFVPHAKAGNGEHGRGSDQHGASGKNKILHVPLGTIVYGAESGDPVAEILYHGHKVVLLKGGEGGLGNTAFKSSTNQAPRQTTPGTPGEEGNFVFVLKTIADLGLVGFPNAGKSSLIGLITNAHPKTAPYPFTTLQPSVGVIEYPEEYRRLLLADIPGLIEGASENRGLGHRFLRHIERCPVLVIIIDMAGIDGRNPWDDYTQLLEELRLYDEALLEKPRLVVANKMDEPAAVENIKKFRRKHKKVSLFPVSCLTEEGIPELKKAMLAEVDRAQSQSSEDYDIETRKATD